MQRKEKKHRLTSEAEREGTGAAEEIERLRLITDSIPALIAYVDAGHRYRFNNKVYEEWFGQRPSDLYGRHVKEILGEGAYASLLPYIEKALSGERVVFDGKVPYRDGGERYIQATYSPHWVDGKVKGYFSLVQDITAQRQAEKTLRESQRVLSTLMSNLPGMAYRCKHDRDWTLEFVSEGATELTGYPPADLIGNKRISFAQLIHPDDLDYVTAEIERAVREKRPFRIEYRILDAAGGEKWVWEQGRGVYLENGGLAALEGFISDITEHKRAEEFIHQREEQYRTLVAQAADGIFMADVEGNFIDVNTRGCAMLGYAKDELIRRRFVDLILPEDLAETPPNISELQGGKTVVTERRLQRKDGTLIHVEVSSKLLSDGRLQSIVRDVTERKQAEEERKERETLLEIALEAGKMGVFEFSVRSGKVTWSPNLERIHGLEPGMFGGTFEDFKRDIHPDDSGRVLNRIQQTVREKRTDYGLEYRIIKPGGETVWVEARGRVFYDSSGEAERFVGLCMDVTARKQAEKERADLLAREQQARREAEAANRAKDEFLATVSHELRTPLNAIYGWARLLQMGDLDRETVTSSYETIERNAKAQAQLIDDLLDVSRIIAGKLRLDVRPIELGPVIEAAIETVQTAADAKGITLDSAFDEKIGPISGDPDRLQQVVWNLLSNAIKFTPNGGRVEVRLNRIDSAIHAVQIHVRDTGIGIPPEFLPYVFDRFRQAEGASTRLYGGLGLGLAIVRHLVELHGGTVSADSPGEGKGANFTVTLPLKVPSMASLDLEMRGPAEEGMLPPTPARMLDGIEILLVDDEADARELLTLILQKAGARVATVSSVREAIDRLKEKKPDLLVSDIEMPGEDGYSLIRKVRAREAERGERGLPAVALTAYAGRADRRRALMAGFHKHVPKPVDPSGLVAVVASLIGLPREMHRAPDRSSDEATSR